MLVLRGKTRWSLILLSLFVMIASGMVSTLMIQRLETNITDMRKQAADDDALISSLWQNVLQDENKTHLMVMYALLQEGQEQGTKSPDAATLHTAYTDFLKLRNGQRLSLKTLPDILEAREMTIFQKIDRIDDTYLAKQERERVVEKLSSQKTLIMNIALFLQLFSLAVITIVRDLK